VIPFLNSALTSPRPFVAVCSESVDLAQKIRWLLLLRVVVVSFFLGATALVHFVRTDGGLGYLFDLSIPLIGAYAISLGSLAVLPRIKNLRMFVYAQVAFDVVLITGIIRMTGDISSPFSFLYNLAVMNGAILLFYRGAYLAAVFSSLSYAGLLIWSRYSSAVGGSPLAWTTLFPIVQSIASYFVIAGLSGFLTNKLNATQKLLKEKQDDYRDLDALKDALLEGIGSGVAILDTEGRIGYFNHQAQTLTTLDAAAISGKRLNQIFPDIAGDFQRKLSNGAVVQDELAIATLQKQIRLTVAPLHNDRDQLIGYLSIFDDITKQKQIEEKIRVAEELRRAREIGLGRHPLDDKSFQFEGVVGSSGGLEKIYHLVRKVAATNTNVLISGESGTGKELIARSIHLNGPRRDRPFVAVNCGAIPDALMESEFFGHVRGAFTGAVSDHSGLFKQADQGTIFLDEVADLPLHLQVKLLRVLQEKSFTPVGGSRPIKVDVRVISATNKDLRKELEEGRFREDLFYRLNVVQMVVPPLRVRKDDIPTLAHYFLQRFAASHSKKVEELATDALVRLMAYSYPGNVRELENIVEHAVTVATKNVIGLDDLPQYLTNDSAESGSAVTLPTVHLDATEAFFANGLSLDAELESYERRILLEALKRASGVQKRAAELLGVNYRSLRHRLDKYQILSARTDPLDRIEDSQ
jgi:PAS domain S-box-containing protein